MGARIELTAAAAEDPVLEDRLRAEPPEERAALLAEADRLRVGGDAQRRLAHLVYRALHADLAPDREPDARRAAWFVSELKWLHPAAAPLVRKTADRCADPQARLGAAVLAARYAEFDGDLDAADRLLREVVDAVRGTRGPLEFTALFHTARVAANHEDCARALACAARALAIRTPEVPLLWVGLAHRCRADAFAVMRDATRCERELLAAESTLSRLSAADATIQRAGIATARAHAHLRRGRPDRAVGYLEQALEHGGEAHGGANWAHVLYAQAMTELGHVDRAATHVARALRSGVRDEVLEFELDLVKVRLQRIAGGPASARPASLALLDRLGAAGRRVVGPDRRARLALEIAKVLSADADLAGARRAYDLAATSIVEAISRIDREAAARPEMSTFDVDDLVALAEFRESEAAAHREVERAVAAFLEEAARRAGPSFLADLVAGGSRLTACAWCSRVRGSDGQWLPIGHYLPSEDVLDLTHGVCDACEEPLRREAARASTP